MPCSALRPDSPLETALPVGCMKRLQRSGLSLALLPNEYRRESPVSRGRRRGTGLSPGLPRLSERARTATMIHHRGSGQRSAARRLTRRLEDTTKTVRRSRAELPSC